MSQSRESPPMLSSAASSGFHNRLSYVLLQTPQLLIYSLTQRQAAEMQSTIHMIWWFVKDTAPTSQVYISDVRFDSYSKLSALTI